MSDLISRQAAIECLSNLRCGVNCFDEEERSQYTALSHAIAEIELLPSAYPETDDFCTDCKEYDSERHFCPRFDRVIKTTIEEMGIIHCKDCKHGELFSDQYLCRKDVIWREGDFYCGYARRREK